ncbi:unnamed protein product [Trifolium pratense]|uniref:Uncharacterized protein n=1 Tax=Trifolium pratense TaxID=57577 RepID=A0ACB0IE34_TRIPR|nr:unnamed protein product [Trifolium pratense]
MFLSRCEQEINLNRKLAKELVDKWSRPIFNKSTRFEDMQNSEDDRVPYRRPSVKKPANKAAGMASRDGDLDLDLSQPRVDDAIDIMEYIVDVREEKLGTTHFDVVDEKRRLDVLLKETGRVRNRKTMSLPSRCL